MEKKPLQWHPAFCAVIQIELQEEKNLEFLPEYELSKKPMRIDVLIIRKTGNQPIRKNIGRIFKKYNLIEYKSPDDYLSINDFYKVYGYACFFQSDTEKVHEVKMSEITLTFVCNHYPREMLQKLRNERGLEVRKAGDGIYYLENDPLPIQIILSHELPPDENRWLNNLRDDLQPDEQTNMLLQDYQEHRNSRLYQAAMDLIVRANQQTIEEVEEMCDALEELFADKIDKIADRKAEERVKARVEEQVAEHDNRMAALFQRLLADNRMEDLRKASEEKAYREKLYLEYSL